MRIYVRLNTKRSFNIPAPIGLVKAVLSLGVSIARRYIPVEQRKYIDCIDFQELRKGFDVLKAYKGLKIVEVKTEDGTEVIIVV